MPPRPGGLHQCRRPEEDRGLSGQDEAPGLLPPQSPDADQMADRADERLFSAVVSNKNHVLHSRLPVKRPKIYDLRPRAHDYSLPPKDEQNFITPPTVQEHLQMIVFVGTALFFFN